jgi:hypothetical protein
MPRNPYHIEDQEPTLRMSVFVFMDILGYSEMIRQSEKLGTGQQMLRSLHQALIEGRDWLAEREPDAELSASFPKDFSALKAFTDNIVMGAAISCQR